MGHNRIKLKKPRIAESIELVATNGPMTGVVSPIPKKDAPESSFEITETETEIAITVRSVVLHATQIRGDTSLARGISKSFKNNKPIRAYEDGGSLGMIEKNNQSLLYFPLRGLEEVIANAKAKGKTIRLCKPEGGIPVFFGDDWLERFDALQRKAKK